MNLTKKRVVVCAAIRNKKTGQIVCGARHFDKVMRGLLFVDGQRPPDWITAEQGFIDQFGVFLTRLEAWDVAAAADQLTWGKDRPRGPLFSEDLY